MRGHTFKVVQGVYNIEPGKHDEAWKALLDVVAWVMPGLNEEGQPKTLEYIARCRVDGAKVFDRVREEMQRYGNA